MCDLEFRIAFKKNCRNEPHILASIMKLQGVVEENAKGQMLVEWEDDKLSRKANITINLPGKEFDADIDNLANDIGNLIAEEEERECEKKRIVENLSEIFDESDIEDNESDDSWKPSNEENDKIEKNTPLPEKQIPVKSKVSKKIQKNDNQARHKYACPLWNCKSKVTHLPRHMRNVHKWSKEAASKVLLKFNMRKRKSPKKKEEQSKKPVDYHRRRRCPIDGCHSVVWRLPAHLHKVHKMDRSSTEYREALMNAIQASGKNPLARCEEACKSGECLEQKVPETCKTSGECSAEYHAMSSEAEESSDDNEDMEDGMSDDFDTVISGNISTDHVLKIFAEWLKSPDGGKRDRKTVSQHTCQLYKILQAIDVSEEISSLLDLKLIRAAFLKTYVEAKNYEAATIKSYLMSLRHYYSFLLSERPVEINFNADELHAAREKVALWSTSYKRESCTRKWQKLEEDMGNLLTPANIKAFEKSAACREAIKVIGQFSDPTNTATLTQASYTLVRDFLFTQIFIDNANRPGVLSFMTTSELQKMRQEGEDFVVAVMKHKTVHVHGPAHIVLSTKLKSWLLVFVEIMRCHVARSSSSGPVFLSWNGQSMTSGQINKAVQSVFRKAGIEVKVTSTSFRKAAVTTVHEKLPEMSGKLANLMAHNEATAKKYYLLSEKAQTSVQASKELGKLMRGESPKEVSSKDTEIEEKFKRVPWTPEEEDVVQKHFSLELMSGNVTMNDIREKIKSNKELHGISPHRIYHKLKKIVQNKCFEDSKRQPPTASETLFEKVDRMSCASAGPSQSLGDSSVSIVAPTERTNSLFADEELVSLKKLFPDMIKGKPISGVQIKKRCLESTEGKKLLEKYSVFQLINRLKHERRKARRV